jgi:phage repressor protein C with HTH and peptisase S24 domain
MKLGLFLKRIRENLPLTQQEAAAKGQMSVGGIARLERAAEAIDDVHPSTLGALAQAYGYASREQLVEQFRNAGRGKAPSAPGRGVPRVGEVVGGAVAETFDPRHSDANDELPLPLEWFPGAIASKVRGSSMSPKYNDGDWVILIQTESSQIKTGWECYIEMQDGGNFGGTLKKVVHNGDRLLLLPINDGEHDPIQARASDVRLTRRAVGKYVPYVRNFGFDAR